jgi:hypothetical protein
VPHGGAGQGGHLGKQVGEFGLQICKQSACLLKRAGVLAADGEEKVCRASSRTMMCRHWGRGAWRTMGLQECTEIMGWGLVGWNS